MLRGLHLLAFFPVALFVVTPPVSGADFSRAVIVAPPQAKNPIAKAIEVLAAEAEKRTGLRWKVASAWPSDPQTPVIAVGPAAELSKFAGPHAQALGAESPPTGAEGYRIRLRQSEQAPHLLVVGNDPRGVLFGVGHLLRALHMTPGRATLADDFDVATAPRYPLRGHQLGYRPKTNSYDAWDLPQWEQYIRDLAIFGSNAIELVPPRTDDAASSPHFPRPQLEMMTGMSQIADAYDVDVWIWYPAMDKDYSDPRTVEFALAEWDRVYQAVPRIDAIFVPGGDPGHTQPKHLLALLEKQTELLHQTHPQAEMWVSPQSFNEAWMAEFLEILRQEPKWLTGVVFGPQVRLSLPQLRAAVPARYPIRHYPDITHSRQCQYPVPDWDVAFAVTSARECINPRPTGMATIFRLLQPHTNGFLTYSEGCNDDVNKFIWSGLGWNPDTPVSDILRDYSGYFIGERYRDTFAQGLLALERNWRGSVLANPGIETTLLQFQDLERQATPAELRNWRLQQGLYRAYYDAYIRRRLMYETELENEATDRLRQAKRDATLSALDDAEAILARADRDPVARDLRARVFELAEALFQSIQMQTSVPRYQAIGVDRGATLDTVDFPLNNREWLVAQFKTARNAGSERERLAQIDALVRWTDPGPGGFYDDTGNPARQPHVVWGLGFDRDPAFLESAHAGFEETDAVLSPEGKLLAPQRIAWFDHAEAMLEFPLRMRYTELDPAAQYKLRIVYAGDSPRKQIRLVANDRIEIHPMLTKPFPCRPIEFEVPRAATQGGELNLAWYRQSGLGDNGRGCQVSEIWLIREPDPK
ncbi:MAG: hypothetical protein JNG90_06570 [Planctomycetaceae bacterium]|nr:hypothetical protein [Planctomycetaceae bacterium]